MNVLANSLIGTDSFLVFDSLHVLPPLNNNARILLASRVIVKY